jgi:hypothetical protein
LVDRVKDDIYNAASYRNINVVNFLRWIHFTIGIEGPI